MIIYDERTYNLLDDIYVKKVCHNHMIVNIGMDANYIFKTNSIKICKYNSTDYCVKGYNPKLKEYQIVANGDRKLMRVIYNIIKGRYVSIICIKDTNYIKKEYNQEHKHKIIYYGIWVSFFTMAASIITFVFSYSDILEYISITILIISLIFFVLFNVIHEKSIK